VLGRKRDGLVNDDQSHPAIEELPDACDAVPRWRESPACRCRRRRRRPRRFVEHRLVRGPAIVHDDRGDRRASSDQIGEQRTAAYVVVMASAAVGADAAGHEDDLGHVPFVPRIRGARQRDRSRPQLV
jgi:hypothetical protein